MGSRARPVSSERETQPQSANQPATRQADVVSAEQREVRFTAEAWSGPLPPPDVLRSYEDVVPGAAERILVITEDQSKHRMAMEKDAQKGDFRITYLGLATAFTLSLTLIGVGAFTVCIGYAWAGTSIVGVNSRRERGWPGRCLRIRLQCSAGAIREVLRQGNPPLNGLTQGLTPY